MSSAAGVGPPKYRNARIALVGLDDSAAAMLTALFEQFNIATEPMNDNAAARLGREKFDGCVVRLEPGAELVLQAARKNAANQRMVVYGVCNQMSDARPYSKFGINVLLTLPLERREALRAIKGTHLLVLHEFRRYVRIPLATTVTISVRGGEKIKGTSSEVSGGGMSLQLPVKLAAGEPLEVWLSLENDKPVRIPGVVRWTRNDLTGIRFEDEDARVRVKEWIDRYLGF
jgi:PilZ domain